MERQIILASSSPRRKQLLESLGIKFLVVPSKFEEDMDSNPNPSRLATELAIGKATEVASRKSGIIIGSDTLLYFNGEMIGKPHTPEKAKETLRKLSGKEHEVHTGVCIIDTEKRIKLFGSRKALVKFRNFNDDTVDWYVSTQEPLDKAGAYAIQSIGSALVENIKGDYTAIMGLPIGLVESMLKKLDVI